MPPPQRLAGGADPQRLPGLDRGGGDNIRSPPSSQRKLAGDPSSARVDVWTKYEDFKTDAADLDIDRFSQKWCRWASNGPNNTKQRVQPQKLKLRFFNGLMDAFVSLHLSCVAHNGCWLLGWYV